MKKQVAVVGAGILGLAQAYCYAKRGHKVRVYERSPQAAGASVRNFGMIWPIGQASGLLCDLAMRSRELWLQVLEEAKLHYLPTGSVHLTYRTDEKAVAQEFAELHPERGRWIGSAEALAKCPAAVPDGLLGALYSEHEIAVDPRQVLAALPAMLREKYGVEFHFSTGVTDVSRLEADIVFVCSGDDFETLYPEVFANSGVTRCKLQMMRTVRQPQGWSMGPALAGGLTLRFYQSFKVCSTLAALEKRIAEETPEYDQWGIHVMASSTADGAVTIGDSHEYGLAVDIFNKERIDRLILDYLKGIARFPNMEIAERWHGVYARHFDRPFFYEQPDPDVYIVTASAGKGMTVSFGLAELLYENPSRHFDWVGTVVDYGCNAPPAVLKQVFASRGVELTAQESRYAMGLLKLDQIREIAQLPRVREAWVVANSGSEPRESDVRELFELFGPLQMDCIEAYSDVIEGVPELVEKLRSAGIRIGSSTGYTRPMLDRLLPKAARQGYAPDCIVTPDMVGCGRPQPWMIFENLRQLDAYPPGRCIKVGDTPSDIEEGRNAGLITVGVCDSSNEAAVEGPAHAREVLTKAGADHLIALAPELWSVLEEL